MTNREKLISHYTKWLKSLDDTDLAFTAVNIAFLAIRGSSVTARLIVMSMTIIQMIVIQMIIPV